MNPLNKTIALEVLKEANAIFKANNLEYFLIYGTCLGAIRDKNFVETDTDIDLGCRHEDLIPKIKKLMADFRAAGFIVYGFSYPYDYLRAFNAYKYDVLIDIRNFELFEDKRFLQRIDSNREDVANVYFAGHFEVLDEIDFLGMKVKIPANAEGYLSWNYGPDWKIPNPDFHKSVAGVNGWWKAIRRTVLVHERKD